MAETLTPDALVDLALAIGLGLLVGFQRQAVHEPVAGIRTFALLTLLGCLCGMLVPTLGPWIVPAGLLGVVALLVVANAIPPSERHRAGERGKSAGQDPAALGSLTTEVAALVMFLVGAWLPLGTHAVSLVVTGAVAVLLWAKQRLHDMVSRTTAEDLHAIMQFVLIALVILPVLPDRSFGPFAVLNPREIWLVVVLVVAVSLAGYGAQRAFGSRAGTVATGILGGVISSTATTVGLARRSRDLDSRGAAPELARAPAAAAVIASTVAFLRVSGLALGLAGSSAARLAGPLLVMSLVMTALSVVQGRRAHAVAPPRAERASPRELSTAIVFGGLYAGVILAVAFARDHLGATGLYGVSILAGLTDVDAISLSTARMVASSELPVPTGWRMILLASLSNLAFKGGVAVVLGSRPFARDVGIPFALATAVGVSLLVLWP